MEIGTEVSVTQTSAKPADSEVDTMAGISTVCMCMSVCILCVCVCVGGGMGYFMNMYTPIYIHHYTSWPKVLITVYSHSCAQS